MDFTSLTEYFVLVVVVACLLIGWALKHASFFKWVKNDDIPVILIAVGAIVNVLASGPSLESVVFGGLMGLASTGMHQTFKNFIENNNTGE